MLRLSVKRRTMVIEKYMLTIGVRSVGGRPDITFEKIYFFKMKWCQAKQQQILKWKFVGGWQARHHLCREFTFKSCLNHFQQQIHPSKSTTKLFVGKEKQQNLMKHPKLKVSLTVIKKMVMFNIVEIPSVIFSPKRWKRDSTEHRDDNYYAGCDRDDDTWLSVFEKHCENDNVKHYNDDDRNA